MEANNRLATPGGQTAGTPVSRDMQTRTVSWPPCASGVGRRGTVRLPNGTTWLLKWVSELHIHAHYLVR
jgi:hypothetical protein